MPKFRGFQPKGMINPIALARECRNVPEGPSYRDKIEERQKRGVTMDDLKQLALKKEMVSGSETLEKWENDNYRKELDAFRESKLSSQEKKELKRLRKEKKSQKREAGERDRSRDRSSDRKKDKKDKKKRKIENPHRLSTFFNMKIE